MIINNGMSQLFMLLPGCVVDDHIGETRIMSPHPAISYPKDRKFNELLQTITYDICRNKLRI